MIPISVPCLKYVFFIFYFLYLCVDRWRIFAVIFFFLFISVFFLYQFNLIKNSYICLRGSEGKVKQEAINDYWLYSATVQSIQQQQKKLRKISYLYRDDHLVCWLLICDKLNKYKRAKQSLNTHDMNSRSCYLLQIQFCQFMRFGIKIWKQQRWKRWKDIQKLLKYVNANLLLVLKAQ